MVRNDPTMQIFRIAGLLAFASAAQCAFAALDRDQFVAGWPIELPSDGSFFDIPLTYETYRYGRAVDEMAVLDRDGEPMPFYRVGVPAPTASEEGVKLGVSPIYLREEEEAIADISVATKGDSTDVTVIAADEKEGEAEVVAFIIDARDVAGIPSMIELEWRPLDRPFLMSVSIEHSEALTEWRRVGEGSVATLSIDGVAVIHKRVAVTGREGGYYRVTWDRRVSDWQLESALVIRSQEAEAAVFSTIDLDPSEVPMKDAGEDSLYFDLGGQLPATHAQIAFSKRNRWASASIHVADAVEGPWRQISRPQLIYDVDYEGQRLASAPLYLGRVESRYWRLTFHPDRPAEPLKLRLRYPREHLRFAANGEPPYMLVGGTLSEQAGPDATFAAVMDALDGDEQQVAEVIPGPRTVLGGDAALETPSQFPWRSVLLWAVLLVAGLTVAWMALRLAREMSPRT